MGESAKVTDSGAFSERILSREGAGIGKQLDRVSPAITADGKEVMKDLGSEMKRK